MSGNKKWQRRQAIQIAAQLPEDTKDALQVLELAKEIVEGFWEDQERERVVRPSLAAVPRTS
jgi:hypothetical protein